VARTRLAILYPGDRAARDLADPTASRFAALFDAFAAAGVKAEPAVYHDDFADEVQQQLAAVHGVLVWHNPVEGGRTRERLDAMLRAVAAKGVLVSTHPDAIMRLGTKDVLLAVRDLPFGSDVHRVDSVAQLARDLPARLTAGARVLKQHRGQSGSGIWRVELLGADQCTLQHAERNSPVQTVNIARVLEALTPYFEDNGHMIDQAWQPRMVEGMTRAYMVQGRVAGFGHQAVVALHPANAHGPAPAITPRYYSDATDARFQDLRQRLEQGWMAQLCDRVGLKAKDLPLLWDADFLLGDRAAGEPEKYVLCEINVSSVDPFPVSAQGPLVRAVCDKLLG
jgi:hypothetical protein